MWHSVSSYCLTPTCVWLVVYGGLDSTSHMHSFGDTTIVELSEFKKDVYKHMFVFMYMNACISVCMSVYMYISVHVNSLLCT